MTNLGGMLQNINMNRLNKVSSQKLSQDILLYLAWEQHALHKYPNAQQLN